MRFIRFALGVRFDPNNVEVDEALAKASMEALLNTLSVKDLKGLELHGGLDEITVPGKPAFIAVIKGGSLKVSRRIHEKISAALGHLLATERPFIENNRVVHIIEALSYYGQVGPDGKLKEGEGCFGLACV